LRPQYGDDLFLVESSTRYVFLPWVDELYFPAEKFQGLPSLLVPLAIWIGFIVGHSIPKPPTLHSNLWQLMFGMLGMGALRSLEKLKGVAR